MNRYSKRIAAAACVVCLLAVLFCSGFTLTSIVQTESDSIPIYIDNVLVTEGSKIGDTTYVPIRAFCEMLTDDVTVSWEQNTKTVTVEAPGLVINAIVGENYMMANDRPLYIAKGIFNLDGTVVVPIRVIAQAFGVEINWNAKECSIDVGVDDMEVIEPAGNAYDKDDLFWLSHLIYAESGNQSLEGMIAVGNVVLNRVESNLFPNTIYGVISQSGQFDVFSGGTIYSNPNDLSVIAAMLCLDGVEVIEEGYFFVNPGYGADSWFKANLTYITSIEDHDFYA